MSKILEFLVVLGVSAVIAVALAVYISEMSIPAQIKPWIPWGSFFAIPMMYVSIRR